MTVCWRDFLDMESSLIVNLHIQSGDQVKAIKTVKRKITDLTAARSRNRKRPSAPGMTWTSVRLVPEQSLRG